MKEDFGFYLVVGYAIVGMCVALFIYLKTPKESEGEELGGHAIVCGILWFGLILAGLYMLASRILESAREDVQSRK